MPKPKWVALIDVGNSYVECALTSLASSSIQIGAFKLKGRFETATFSPELLDLPPSTTVFISSVVPSIDPVLRGYFKKNFFIHYRSISPFFNINLTHPADVGSDRLLNAYAAFCLVSGPVLVVDSGTATTFCLVDPKGIYQGGAIFPGLGISSKALNLFTAKIPLIKVRKRDSLIGKSTLSAVQSGLYWSFILAINGLVSRFRVAYPDLKVVGTGQGIKCLKEDLNLDYFEPILIFKGLKLFALALENKKSVH